MGDMAGAGDISSDLEFGATIRDFVAGQKLFERYQLKDILGRGGMGGREEMDRDFREGTGCFPGRRVYRRA
jgi:hypothetical protein